MNQAGYYVICWCKQMADAKHLCQKVCQRCFAIATHKTP